MKKMFKALLIFCVAFWTVASAAPVFAGCHGFVVQGKGGQITGGACSIKELNNLENTRTVKGKTNIMPDGGRDLRPIKSKSEMSQSGGNCLLGICLYQTILRKEIMGK